jgi:hypothetical protein
LSIMVGGDFGFFARAVRCLASQASAILPVLANCAASLLPWLNATAGIPRRAAIFAAPTVPDRSVREPTFWPGLMPDITTFGFTPSWSSAAVMVSAGKPWTAVAS